MAWNKEATVILLDVGSYMSEQEDGKLSHFDTSMQCITRMLQNKLFTESKDEFSLILCGAEETDNRLNGLSDSSYMSIKTETDLKMVDWEILDALAKIQEPTNVHDGDVFEALKVALDVIEEEEAASKKKRFVKRRIVLFSNLHGVSDASKEQIARFVKDMELANINMMQLIGVDLEAEKLKTHQNGHKSKADKKKHGKPALETLHEVFDSLSAVEEVESYSFGDALRYTNNFSGRQVRPTPWNGLLEIGETLKIPVVMFSRIKEAKPKQSWKKAYAADPSIGIQQSTQFFRQVGLQREEVKTDELVEAYRYGVTQVPFSEEDKKNMKFANVGKCMKALGFASVSQVKAHLFVGDDVKILTAALADEAAQTALSALVHALKEDDMVIICKYGYNRISAPKMVALAPHISEREVGKYEGLYVHYLPFEDDLRLYTFAPLIDNKRKIHLQPNEEQLEAVGSLVDKLTVHEQDGYFESLNPKFIRNPHLQRLYHSLQYRALNPDKPLPPLDERLVDQMTMPKELANASAADLDKVKILFPLKKVEKQKFRRENVGVSDQPQDIEMANGDGIDAGSAVGQLTNFKPAVTTVGTIAAVDDFMALIDNASNTKFDEAVKKAADVVNEIIFGFDGSLYAEKVLKLILAVRRESVTKDRTFSFNMFLKSFKADLLSRDLKEVWEKLVEEKVTLIDQREAAESDVSRQEAEDFFKVTAVKKASQKKAASKNEEDDMFAEMFA